MFFQVQSHGGSNLEQLAGYICEGDAGDSVPRVLWGMKDTLILSTPKAHTKHGTTLAHVVWKNKRARTMEFLQSLAIDENSVVRSQRSAEASSRMFDCRFDQRGLHEMTMDSEALVASLVFWATCSKTAQDRRLALVLLEDWLRTLLGRDSLDWAWDYDELQEAGRVECSDREASRVEHCCHMPLVPGYEAYAKALYWPDLRELLVALATARDRCDRLNMWLQLLIAKVAVLLDDIALKASPTDAALNLERMSRGKKRMRHHGSALRRYVMEQVASKRFRSATACLRGLGSPCDGRTGRDAEETTMAEYWWASIQLGRRTIRWNIATDASRLGGEDTSVYAAYLPKFDIGFWMPPQAGVG